MGAPNFIRLFIVRGYIPHFAYYIVHMMVPIGFIADAMIYTFNLNAVRRAIRNMIQRRNSIYLGKKHEIPNVSRPPQFH